MGKRTNFPNIRPRDEWDTPHSTVKLLIPHIGPNCGFIEPCAGRGNIVNTLTEAGLVCLHACDIAPRGPGIVTADGILEHICLPATYDYFHEDNVFPVIITNPPYARAEFERLLTRWLDMGWGIWLLLPSDWLMNRWFSPYAPHVVKIVPVGRISWLGNGKAGMENSAWVQFDPAHTYDFVAQRNPGPNFAERVLKWDVSDRLSFSDPPFADW